MPKPLIFFVHVPKTAGSTVNDILAERMPNGLQHCEAIIENHAAFEEAANRYDWMSGHVDLSTALDRFSSATDRPVRYFTCIREPMRQVMSHYNWLIEIHRKGGSFYDNHPQAIKRISLQIRKNSESVQDIISNLTSFPGLFRNCQSRYILGRGFNWNGGELHHRLDTYEAVGVGEIARLLEVMIKEPVEPGRRSNASPYHFDTALFDDPDMKDFLKRWNVLDELLYRALKGR